MRRLIASEIDNGRFKMVSSVHLFLVDGDRILLSQRCGTGYEDGNYSVVAGHIEKGESAILAIIREAKEEAGINIKRSDVHFVHAMHRKCGDESLDLFFWVEVWKNTVRNAEPHLCSDLSWFDLEYLPSNIVDYISVAINNVLKGMFYSEYGWNASTVK